MFALGLLGCTAPYQGSNPKSTGQMVVPLVPRATEAGYVGDVPVNAAKLWLDVADERDSKDQIGQNTEDERKPAIKVLAAKDGDDPAKFVLKMMEKQLKDLGIPTVGSADSAERKVVLKLTHFWAEESPSYRGNVQFVVEVSNSGSVIWRGNVVGESGRFGRSLSTDNYQETLSDATVHAMNRLLAQPGFQSAITKK